MTLLLPLVENSSLRRVVTVAGGGHEGPVDFDDLQALRLPVSQLRGHLATMITLGLEAIAPRYSTVSFIHSYPGSVVTGLYRDLPQPPFDPARAVPIDECGERHLYIATSARFTAQGATNVGVSLEDVNMAVQSNGSYDCGVYTLGQDCECASEDTLDFLAELRQKSSVQNIWQHTREMIEKARDVPN